MKKLSLKPDADMILIYDCYHPDYNSDYAKYLREARANALSLCPRWMIEQARINDLLDTPVHNAEIMGGEAFALK